MKMMRGLGCAFLALSLWMPMGMLGSGGGGLVSLSCVVLPDLSLKVEDSGLRFLIVTELAIGEGTALTLT